jgi:transposase
MSLKPSSIPPIPAETAAVVRAAFRRAPLPVRLRDEFGALYEDADFAALFPVRGQPALPPWRLALVTVLQFVEGLSDRQAADAVRARIDWKYALSLELSDPGFDHSVLSEFRARLVASGHEQVLLDRLLEHAATRGLVRARTPQRTDSTHVLAAVRTLNRLELVGESVRAALNALAAAAPDWLRGVAPPEWHARYDHRVEGSRQPTSGPARERLLRTLGEDGTALLAAVGAPNTPPMLRELPAVAALRRVLARYYAREPSGPDGHDADVDTGTGVLRPRTRGELAHAPRAVESPYEADARYCGRSGLEWVGYMMHLSETCAPGLPRLVTHVDTTPAGAYEATRVDAIHAALAAKGLLPAVHLADGAYISAALLVRSAREHGVTLRGPTKAGNAWQGRDGGFTPDAFRVDWQRQRVTCPAGQTSSTWRAYDGAATDASPARDPFVKVRFAPSTCDACALRARCVRTPGSGRQLALHLRAAHEALAAARAHHASAEGQREYALRSGIEATMSQAVRAFGLRRARYRGLAKTHLQGIVTAVAVDLARLDAWLAGRPVAPTRVSRFARLAA